MKSVISIIGLISTINGSSRLLQQFPTPSLDCAAITCEAPSGCIDGIGCVALCNDVSDCRLGQQCSGGNCVEICGGILGITCSIDGDECVDSPLDDCDPDNGGSDCGGFCLLGSSPTEPECGVNEVWNDCGTACPAKCSDTGPVICTLQCVRGCECADGFILDEDGGSCIAPGRCPGNPCPNRCTGGFDGCNGCGCDGLGNPTFCTQRACFIDELGLSSCGGCVVGYEVNNVTNTCEPEKVSCSRNRDCDRTNGFRCRRDPECREFSDVTCRDAGRVCIDPSALNDACNSNNDCDTEGGFGCLLGDGGDGRCVKYQTP